MQNSNITIFLLILVFMCLWHMYQIQNLNFPIPKSVKIYFHFDWNIAWFLHYFLRFHSIFLMSFSRRRPENKIYWILHSIPFPVPVVIIDFYRIFKNIFIIISTNKKERKNSVLLMGKHFLFFYGKNHKKISAYFEYFIYNNFFD